ncbi:MAG: PAS domain-containing protein [Actinobacteria bacterium]|nr:PAS domain-containing protein [Actinomycetota bacterium]
MNKKNIISASDETILKLKLLAKEKESIRRKLMVTAGALRIKAKQLAETANEKESVRRKLVATAAEKEDTRSKLAKTAKEKESVRRKLVATAAEKEDTRSKLAITAKQLAATAEEKESIRRKLEVTAKNLAYAKATDEAMLESIGDGILATDEKGNITLINKIAEKLICKKSQEVMGKVFYKVFPLEDEKGVSIPAEKHPINLALMASTISVGLLYYQVRKDKTRFPVAIMATPVILEGKVIGAIKVFRDITIEKEIEHAKSEFVSVASHQLKTPVTIMNLYAEQLLNSPNNKLTGTQKEYINEISNANRRLIDIVDTLLNISRIEMGIFFMNPAPVDIIDFLKNVIKNSRINLEEKNLIMQQEYHQLEHILLIDKLLLNMVFSNLLTNAIRYTSSGGTISVKSLEVKKDDKINDKIIKEDGLLVSVSDNGCGIPADQQNKIFTKFFRSDNARSEYTDGTGLGLYIVKSILDHMGGEVWFLSKEKEGTTFSFTIPFSKTKI